MGRRGPSLRREPESAASLTALASRTTLTTDEIPAEIVRGAWAHVCGRVVTAVPEPESPATQLSGLIAIRADVLTALREGQSDEAAQRGANALEIARRLLSGSPDELRKASGSPPGSR